MKKKVILFSLLILILLSFQFVRSLDTSTINDASDKIQNTGEQITDTTNKLTDSDIRAEYLKQEWGKILNKSQSGRVLIGVSDTFKALSPIFKLLIGIEYSLSWFFFLCLLAWIVIFVIIYKAVAAAFPNKLIALGIAFIIPAIAAQFKAIETSVMFFMPLLTNNTIIAASIVITIALLILYSYLMKKFGKILAAKLKKEEEENRERKAKTLEKITDIKLKAAGVK